MWSPVHQVEHLRRVQQLFEAPQELDALVVSALRVDKHQQRTGAGRRTGRLPETWTQHTLQHVSQVNVSSAAVNMVSPSESMLLSAVGGMTDTLH